MTSGELYLLHNKIFFFLRMDTKLKIWLQINEETGAYFDDFCAISELGARQWGIPFETFNNAHQISLEPHNIVIGSVESCESFLNNMGLEIPVPIDMLKLAPVSGRRFRVESKKRFLEYYQLYPYFIKSHNKHKAFTAFVAKNEADVLMYTNKFNGDFLLSDVLDIIAEYRFYINKGKLIGAKHYLGDFLFFPDPEFIKNAVNFSTNILPHLSYSLDFGVLKTGETVLIEAQDGWAIGNYGLEPYDYIKFVKDRWLQITGIL